MLMHLNAMNQPKLTVELGKNVPSGTLLLTSSDTHQVLEILKETSIKMYTPKKFEEKD